MRPFTLAILLLFNIQFSLAQRESDRISAAMDSVFKSYNKPDVPGCEVSVIKNGQVIFQKGYGDANLEYELPISSKTVFDIASVSKQFTGLAISTLIQEGKISADDDIHKYLPDVPQFGQKITIKNLIHHTSGLRDWSEALHFAGWRLSEVFTFDDIMRMVSHQKDLDFEPGTAYAYSNTDYSLLAAIVLKVTGQSLKQWEEEHVFKPLGMTSTEVFDHTDHIVKRLASSYYANGNGFGTIPGADNGYGSSAMFSCADDLNKWTIHLMQAIRSKDPVYTRMLEGDVLTNGEKVTYGYGLEVNHDGGVYTVVHNGGWQGYRTIIMNFPDEYLSVILLGNVSNFDANGYATRVARYFLKGKMPSDPVVRDAAADRPTVPFDTVLARKYTGMYQLGPNWYVAFTLENGKLMVQANNENKFPTEAKSDSVFWVPAYGASMNFKGINNAQVNALKFRTIDAKRVAPIKRVAERLAQFSGTYYSPELEVVYRIRLTNGKLTVHNMRLGDFALDPDPVQEDLASGPLGRIQFIRNRDRAVTGFRLTGGRAQNIKFDKW